MLFYPFFGLLRGEDGYGLSRGADGPFTTFTVHTGVETVLWSTGVLPAFDGFLDAYFHTHRVIVDDVWFLRGSPESLGLLEPPWLDAFASYLHEPCEGGSATDVTSRAAIANCANVSARAAAAAAAGDAAAMPGGLISRFKRHLTSRIAASRVPFICKYSEHAAYREGEGRAAGGLVYCPFTQSVRGDVRWTGVMLLRAQKDGAASLPSEFTLHCALRVYHTTLPDVSDDDGRWRDLRKNCSLDELRRPNPDRSCGEEIYVPIDRQLLGWMLAHPRLLVWLLALANDRNLRQLLRLLLGVTRAKQVSDLAAAAGVPIVALLVALGALGVAAAVKLACCCRRRCRGTPVDMSDRGLRYMRVLAPI